MKFNITDLCEFRVSEQDAGVVMLHEKVWREFRCQMKNYMNNMRR